MFKKITIADLYIGLWAATTFLAAYRPGHIPALMLFVLLLISAYYTIYANTHMQRIPYIKALNILVILFSIYGLFEILLPSYRGGHPFVFLQHIYESLLPIYAFYVLTSCNKITEKSIWFWLPIIVIMTILTFNIEEANLLEELTSEETVNNAGYSVLAVFPLLLFYRKKPMFFYLGLAVSFYFVLSGVKRGAIFLATICVFLILTQILKNSSKKTKFWTILLTVCSVFLMLYMVRYMLENSYLFSARYEVTRSGDDSGRSDIWNTLLNHYTGEANIFQMLFGMGIYGTRLVAGIPAHNDWLEILTEEGLIGFSIFFYYWVVLFKTWKKQPAGSDIRFMMLLCIVIMFGKTLFSMSIESMQYPLSLAFGYCLARDCQNNYTIGS